MILIAMRFLIRALGLVSTFILARFLMPEDYGLVAIVTLLYGLLVTMSDFSFGLAIIREKNATKEDYNTAWTLNVLRGVVMALIILGGMHAYADFYEQPELLKILPIYAGIALATGFQNIGVINFMKYMRYGQDFRYMVTVKLVGVTAGITAAVILQNYWALVIGTCAVVSARVVCSYLMEPYRPWFSLASARKFFNFSKWVALTNGLNYLAGRIDLILLGKFAATATVGFYTFALEIATMVTTEVSLPVSRAVYPALAKMQDNAKELGKFYSKGLLLVITITAPMGIGVGIIADTGVVWILGQNWAGIVPILEIMAFYCVIRVVFEITPAPFMALGRPDIPTKLTLGNLAMRGGVFAYMLLNHSLTAALWSLVVVAAIQLLIVISVFRNFGLIGYRQFLEGITRPIAGVAVMLFCINYLEQSLALPVPLMLAVQMLGGGALYALVTLTMWKMMGSKEDAPEAFILRTVKSKLPGFA